MPFITEEIWHAVYDGKPPAKSIALTRFRSCRPHHVGPVRRSKMMELARPHHRIRALRKEIGVEEKAVDSASNCAQSTRTQCGEHCRQNRDIIERLARVSEVRLVRSRSAGRCEPRHLRRRTFDVAVVYERTIDVPAERERLTKDIAKYEKGLAAAERQLGNEGFLAKAPAHIVEGLRSRKPKPACCSKKPRPRLAALPKS